MHGDIVSNVRENLHYLDVSIFNHILSGSVNFMNNILLFGLCVVVPVLIPLIIALLVAVLWKIK